MLLRRKHKPNGGLKGILRVGYVNSYEFDIKEIPPNFKVKIFTKANEEWIDFVLANRLTLGFQHDNDVVIGPVANDNVYAQITLFEGGLISRQRLIEELKAYKLVDQYLFHTERSLQYFCYISNFPVEI